MAAICIIQGGEFPHETHFEFECFRPFDQEPTNLTCYSAIVSIKPPNHPRILPRSLCQLNNRANPFIYKLIRYNYNTYVTVSIEYKRECDTVQSSHLAAKDRECSCIMFENRVILGECFETSKSGGSSTPTSPSKRSRLLITLAPPTSPEDEESCTSSVYDSIHNLETGKTTKGSTFIYNSSLSLIKKIITRVVINCDYE